MKSCPLCRVKISFTQKLCTDCKIIKSFITIKGKDVVLKWIQKEWSSVRPTPSIYPTAPGTPINYQTGC